MPNTDLIAMANLRSVGLSTGETQGSSSKVAKGEADF